MLGILVVLVIAGIGAAFYYINNAEGAIIGDGNGCEPSWFTPTHPGTQEPYTSTDALREDVVQQLDLNQSETDQYMSNVELRNTENGTILQKEEVCA